MMELLSKEKDSSCGCYLCNDVTQHDQDMDYICDECKEQEDS
jgi:hypothetical protein